DRVLFGGLRRRCFLLPSIEQGLEFHDYSAIPVPQVAHYSRRQPAPKGIADERRNKLRKRPPSGFGALPARSLSDLSAHPHTASGAAGSADGGSLQRGLRDVFSYSSRALLLVWTTNRGLSLALAALTL